MHRGRRYDAASKVGTCCNVCDVSADGTGLILRRNRRSDNRQGGNKEGSGNGGGAHLGVCPAGGLGWEGRDGNEERQRQGGNERGPGEKKKIDGVRGLYEVLCAKLYAWVHCTGDRHRVRLIGGCPVQQIP